MRLSFVFLISVLLVGCHHRQPAMPERDYDAFRQSHPGMTDECLTAVRYGKFRGDVVDDPNCFEMLPSQRWSGLWVRGFEWTNFCSDPAKACSIFGAPGESWLQFADQAHLIQRPPEGTYHIEFIGRRTKVPGHFGHLDQYDHLMIVDKLVSIRRVADSDEEPRK